MSLDRIIFITIGFFTLLIVGIIIFTSVKTNVKITREVLIKENSPKKGSENPKVILVEFSDFNCSVCKTVAPLLDDLIDEYEGDLQIVYRYFPLSQKGSLLAARAAEAANLQGKFWDYSDELFDDQGEFRIDELEEKADELGLDVDKFKNDISSEQVNNSVQEDLNLSKKLKLLGTPSFFLIKGEEIEKLNISSFDDIKIKIDQSLGKEVENADDISVNVKPKDSYEGMDNLNEDEKEIVLKVIDEFKLDNLSVNDLDIKVESIEKKEWPDTSIGCPKKDQIYAQVITPGYLVKLNVLDKVYDYHTDSNDLVIYCDDASFLE